MQKLLNNCEKNVLHLLNGEQYSGLERVVDHLAELAPDYGFRFHLACLKPGDMPSRLKTRKSCIHFVGMNSRLDLTGTLEIRRIALRERCQLIHSHTVRSAMVASVLRTILPLPWIHHVHSPAKLESENKRQNYCNYFVEKILLPKADHVVTVSDDLQKYVLSAYNVDQRKITVVRNGVMMEPDDDENFLVHIEPYTVGAVGLFRPRKGVETLLTAIKILVAKGLKVNLKLIGEFVSQEYRKNVEEQIKNAGLVTQIKLIGFEHSIRDQLATLDVFVMPSLYGEGMPMALLEAMAMGRTIVASRLEGITEVLGDGSCGTLVPPGDAMSLAEAIQEALLDKGRSSRLAKAARNRQQSCYGVDSMANGVFEVYARYLN